MKIQHPCLWALGICYVVLTPAAFLIPVNIFDLAPWTRSLADAVAWAVPMINRVVAYGNPHPDKLRFFLAIAWLLMPLLGLILWEYCLHHARKAWQNRGTEKTLFLAIPIMGGVFFLLVVLAKF